jgi:mono/diheme cytochrome c family protein
MLLAAGCDWLGKPDPKKRPKPPDKVMDFALLYEQNCSGCHGAEGKLGPAPPLNDPLFLSIIQDKELLTTIRTGRRGTPMPGFAQEQGARTKNTDQVKVLAGPLTDDQIKALAEGIKSRWGKQGAAASAAKEPIPPYLAHSRGRAERAKEVFMRACAGCHGEQGEGIEEDGRQRRRIHDPAFLALISDQALRRIIITGRPDLGMPNYAEKRPGDPSFKPLTSTEIDDLVALLSSWAPQRPGRGKGIEHLRIVPAPERE